ncbi:hypothetical protein NN561_018834 [Cricetulus griseus]
MGVGQDGEVGAVQFRAANCWVSIRSGRIPTDGSQRSAPLGVRLLVQAARGSQEPAQVRSSAGAAQPGPGREEPAPDPQDNAGAPRADGGSLARGRRSAVETRVSPVRESKGQRVPGEASEARRTGFPATGVAGRRRRGLEPDADSLGAPRGRAPGLGGDRRGGWTAGPAPPDHGGGAGISPPSGLHAPQAAAGTNPASRRRRRSGGRSSESDTEQPRFPAPDSVPRSRPGSPGVRASASAAAAAAGAAAARVTALNPGRGRAGGRGGQGAGRRRPRGTRGVGLGAPDRPAPGQHHLRSCGAHAAATPPPLAPATRARKQNKLQVAAAGGGPGGSLTLILLSGLGSSGGEDREDQRTTSPRKLPTTSKLRLVLAFALRLGFPKLPEPQTFIGIVDRDSVLDSPEPSQDAATRRPSGGLRLSFPS